MLRIVIADDEPNIYTGLKNLISGWDNDFCIVGCFSDGNPVIEFLSHNHADLVISDIRMTGKSGIDILKYVHEHHPDTYVILLSGYSDFEYAHSAINLGAYRYFVKPIDIGALRSALNDLKKKISDEQKHASLFINNKKIVSDILEEFLLDLFSGRITSRNQLDKKLSILGLTDLGSHSVYLFNVKILNFSQIYNSWKYEKNEIYTAVNNYIEEFKFEGLNVFHYNSEADTLRFACFTENHDVNSAVENIHEYFSLLKENLYSDLKIDAELKLLTGYMDSSCIINNDVCYFNSAASDDKEDFSIILKVLFSNMFSDSPDEYKSTMLKIKSLLASMSDSALAECVSSMNNIIKSRYPDIAYTEKLPDSRSGLTNLADSLLSRLEEYRTSENLPYVIRKARSYIQDNFSTDISIEDIANYVYVHPVYLSRYFKKITGQNIHDYITAVRMEYAKKYLRENMSVEDAAYHTGYKNARYFSKVFKLYNKTTPSEYKKDAAK